MKKVVKAAMALSLFVSLAFPLAAKEVDYLQYSDFGINYLDMLYEGNIINLGTGVSASMNSGPLYLSASAELTYCLSVGICAQGSVGVIVFGRYDDAAPFTYTEDTYKGSDGFYDYYDRRYIDSKCPAMFLGILDLGLIANLGLNYYESVDDHFSDDALYYTDFIGYVGLRYVSYYLDQHCLASFDISARGLVGFKYQPRYAGFDGDPSTYVDSGLQFGGCVAVGWLGMASLELGYYGDGFYGRLSGRFSFASLGK
jgi:hypothetical protein